MSSYRNSMSLVQRSIIVLLSNQKYHLFGDQIKDCDDPLCQYFRPNGCGTQLYSHDDSWSFKAIFICPLAFLDSPEVSGRRCMTTEEHPKTHLASTRSL
jgi:hypothetical protein